MSNASRLHTLLARSLFGYLLLLYSGWVPLHHHAPQRSAEHSDQAVVSTSHCPGCDWWVRQQVNDLSAKYTLLRTAADYQYVPPVAPSPKQTAVTNVQSRGPPLLFC